LDLAARALAAFLLDADPLQASGASEPVSLLFVFGDVLAAAVAALLDVFLVKFTEVVAEVVSSMERLATAEAP
jgi:hypothetical protein